jgi:hypothetical protein
MNTIRQAIASMFRKIAEWVEPSDGGGPVPKK